MAIRLISVPGQPDAVGYVGVTPSSIESLKGGPYASRDRWRGLPVLTYDGRRPLVNGVPVDTDEAFRADMLDAIEQAAQRVLGAEWIGHLAMITGLTPRSCQRDRIGKSGLPAPVLQLLARSCAHPMPRALGFTMLAVAHSWRDATADDDLSESQGRMSASAREELGQHLRQVVGVAMDQVDDIRAAVHAFRAGGDTRS